MIKARKETTEDQEAEVDNKTEVEVEVTMYTMLMIHIMMIHMRTMIIKMMKVIEQFHSLAM